MKKSTKRQIKFLLTVFGFIAFIWIVPHYLAFVSEHPIDYYLFRRAISNGDIIVMARDTTPRGWGREDVVLQDTVTGMKYKLEHTFPEHTQFRKPVEEVYENIHDENGKEVCNEDNDEVVLNLLNNKKNN